MANHVYSYICLEEGNDAAQAAWDKFVECANGMSGDRLQDTANCFEMFPETKAMADAEDWSGLHDAIGTKWAYIEECESDYIRVVSAWGVPTGFLERFANLIQEADPKSIITVQYDDEGPNFFGAMVFADGEYDEEYIDADDYERLGLKFWWDEDEDGEEPEDFEPTYEAMSDVQDKEIQIMVDAVKINRGETNYG